MSNLHICYITYFDDLEVSILRMSNKSLEEKLDNLISVFKKLNRDMERFEDKINKLILEISSLAESFSKILMIKSGEKEEKTENTIRKAPDEMYA